MKKWSMKRAAIAAATALVATNLLPFTSSFNMGSTQSVYAESSSNPPAQRVVLVNGSFEEPPYSSSNPNLTKHTGWFDAPQSVVPGWKTTDSSGLFEIMNKTLGDEITPGSPYSNLKVPPAHGQQFAELNSRQAAQLYQDVDTTPGQTIYWRLAHRGRLGPDTMALKIGSANTAPASLPTVKQMTSSTDGWKYYSGSYVVPAGQTKTRFGFEAVSSYGGGAASGNFLDDIFLGTAPSGIATKSVSPMNGVQEGDTLTYTVNFKNEGGDVAGNTVFKDSIPAGTEYIPGSLEIISGPNSGKLTDLKGDDQGEYLAPDRQVIVRLGNGANATVAGRIPNTGILPEGTTVQFKVKVLPNYAKNSITNQATVQYDNLLTGEKEVRESNGTDVDVNRPPISPDFEESTWKDTSVTGSVYGVDTNGDPLIFTKGTDPGHGKVIVNPDGTWEYTPAPGFTGEDSFTVTVSDGKGGTSTSTVKVNVIDPPNEPPVSDNYNVTTQKDTSVTGSVYGTDPDGDTLTYVIESNPEHGKVIVNPNGTWEYIPNPGYVGPDIFTVTVSDGKGGITTSTIKVNVTDKPNQPPVSRDDSASTSKNTSVTGSVYGTDPDGDPLTFTKGTDPKHGKVTVNSDGTWTYTPDPDYVGTDSFTVTISDGRGGVTTSTVTVNVTGSGTNPNPGTDPGTNPGTDPGTNPGTGTDPVKPNQTPTVPSYATETPQNTPVTGKVSGTDSDGDSLTYSKGSDPKHGTVTVNPDGTWTYVPNRDFTGTDSFTVTVSDGRGGTTTSIVTVNVTGTGTGTTPGTTNPGTGTEPGTDTDQESPNKPPFSSDLSVKTPKNTPVTGNLKGTDPDGDPLTYTKASDPKHGKVTVKPNGKWTYVPERGYVGKDSFTVTVSDGRGGEVTITVTVDVKGSGKGTAGSVKPPANTENPTPPAKNGDGTPVVKTPEQQNLNQLPNTSANFYNLGLAGFIALFAGWFLMRRKNKA